MAAITDIIIVLSACIAVCLSDFTCEFHQYQLGEGEATRCVDCPKCPVGQGLSYFCGFILPADHSMECQSCKEGHHSETADSLSTCSPCSFCSANRITDSSCNATHDTFCGACKPGYYMWEDECYKDTVAETEAITTESPATVELTTEDHATVELTTGHETVDPTVAPTVAPKEAEQFIKSIQQTSSSHRSDIAHADAVPSGESSSTADRELLLRSIQASAREQTTWLIAIAACLCLLACVQVWSCLRKECRGNRDGGDRELQKKLIFDQHFV